MDEINNKKKSNDNPEEKSDRPGSSSLQKESTDLLFSSRPLAGYEEKFVEQKAGGTSSGKDKTSGPAVKAETKIASSKPVKDSSNGNIMMKLPERPTFKPAGDSPSQFSPLVSVNKETETPAVTTEKESAVFKPADQISKTSSFVPDREASFNTPVVKHLPLPERNSESKGNNIARFNVLPGTENSWLKGEITRSKADEIKSFTAATPENSSTFASGTKIENYQNTRTAKNSVEEICGDYNSGATYLNKTIFEKKTSAKERYEMPALKLVTAKEDTQIHMLSPELTQSKSIAGKGFVQPAPESYNTFAPAAVTENYQNARIAASSYDRLSNSSREESYGKYVSKLTFDDKSTDKQRYGTALTQLSETAKTIYEPAERNNIRINSSWLNTEKTQPRYTAEQTFAPRAADSYSTDNLNGRPVAQPNSPANRSNDTFANANYPAVADQRVAENAKYSFEKSAKSSDFSGKQMSDSLQATAASRQNARDFSAQKAEPGDLSGDKERKRIFDCLPFNFNVLAAEAAASRAITMPGKLDFSNPVMARSSPGPANEHAVVAGGAVSVSTVSQDRTTAGERTAQSLTLAGGQATLAGRLNIQAQLPDRQDKLAALTQVSDRLSGPAQAGDRSNLPAATQIRCTGGTTEASARIPGRADEPQAAGRPQTGLNSGAQSGDVFSTKTGVLTDSGSIRTTATAQIIAQNLSNVQNVVKFSTDKSTEGQTTESKPANKAAAAITVASATFTGQVGLTTRFEITDARSVPTNNLEETGLAEKGMLLRSLKSTDRRYFTGVEIAIAAILTASGAARLRNGEGAAAPGELLDSKNSIPKPVVQRRTHMVGQNDTLQSIAETLYHNQAVGWLIADLNSANIKEVWIDGKRVIELKTRQVIELPEPTESVNFLSRLAKDFNIDKLVTVVCESTVDRELLHNFLGTVSGAPGIGSQTQTVCPGNVAVIPELTIEESSPKDQSPSRGIKTVVKALCLSVERLVKRPAGNLSTAGS